MATVVARGFCEIFILLSERLEEILERFPGAKDLLHPIREEEALRHAISLSWEDKGNEDSSMVLLKVGSGNPTL